MNQKLTFYGLTVTAVWSVELAFHWLLAANQGSALNATYSTKDIGGKYFVAGALDYMVPAVLIGCIIGWTACPTIKMSHAYTIAFFSAFIIATMRPAYRQLFGVIPFAEQWGNSATLFTASFLFSVLSTFLPAFFFTHAAYVFRRDLKTKV